MWSVVLLNVCVTIPARRYSTRGAELRCMCGVTRMDEVLLYNEGGW